MLEKLIGAQILKVFDGGIKVGKGGKVFNLEIISDDGDCCGYADFETKILYSANDLRNPVITDITLVDDEDDYDGESSVITFYGESKQLITIESEAGSGSGWGYGACVTMRCKELEINEELASW